MITECHKALRLLHHHGVPIDGHVHVLQCIIECWPTGEAQSVGHRRRRCAVRQGAGSCTTNTTTHDYSPL